MLDSSFKEWVLHYRNAFNAFWELWIAEHPEKHEDVKEAWQIVLILNNLFFPDLNDEIESRWEEVCN